jgi:hypothetical protein
MIKRGVLVVAKDTFVRFLLNGPLWIAEKRALLSKVVNRNRKNETKTHGFSR